MYYTVYSSGTHRAWMKEGFLCATVMSVGGGGTVVNRCDPRLCIWIGGRRRRKKLKGFLLRKRKRKGNENNCSLHVRNKCSVRSSGLVLSNTRKKRNEGKISPDIERETEGMYCTVFLRSYYDYLIQPYDIIQSTARPHFYKKNIPPKSGILLQIFALRDRC